MGMSLSEQVRAAVAALMYVTGESQATVAEALGVTQGQVSRRQSGSATWSLDDCDVLAGHFGIAALDLLAGPTRACQALPDARRTARMARTARTVRTSRADDRSARVERRTGRSEAAPVPAPAPTPAPARPAPAPAPEVLS